jgi:hypothetical protein
MIISLGISGCAPEIKERIVYLPTPINLPVKPDIPKMSGKDLACLSDQTKNDLIKRDTIIKSYIVELESSIIATQKN